MTVDHLKLLHAMGGKGTRTEALWNAFNVTSYWERFELNWDFNHRVLWRKGTGSRLQDPWLQGVRWRGRSVPKLSGGGVSGPNRSSPRFPPLALCQWAGPSPPTVTPCFHLTLPSLAMDLLPANCPCYDSPFLAIFPKQPQGSCPAGELPIIRLAASGPIGWLSAGRPAAPRTDSSGLHTQGGLSSIVSCSRPLQTEPAVPSQHQLCLTSTSPDCLLFFSLLLFFHFIIFCPSTSVLPAFCASWLADSPAQELKRSIQGATGVGDWDRSVLKIISNK